MSMTGWLALLLAVATIALLGLALLTRGPMQNRWANVVRNLVRVYARLWHGLRDQGAERIPLTGPVMLASNHTTGIDPLLLQSACPRRIRWVMLTSWRVRALEWLWRRIEPIFLDRGPRDVRNVRAIVCVLERGEVVGFFPEGGLQRERRELNPFHPGIAMIARRSHAPILPVWIEGTPRRRRMLWHFLQPSRSRVTFGEPYRPDPTWSRQQILDDLRCRMRALSGDQ